MFERTKSGQGNRALFYGVDYICYVEGGGGVRDFSPDLSFWSSILSLFRPELKFKILARGGKPELQIIANEIIQKDIKSSLVAMDADYDRFIRREIIDRRVLYTFGYSWENDAFSYVNLEQIYCAICHCDQVPQGVSQSFLTGLSQLGSQLRRAVAADFFALCAGGSVLPRSAPGRVIVTDAVGWPTVAIDQVLALTIAANTKLRIRPLPPHVGPPADTIRYCVGKILAFAARILTKTIVHSNHTKLALSPDHFRDVSLLTLPRCFAASPHDPVVQHHRAQCLQI